jgi:hypothetical protein
MPLQVPLRLRRHWQQLRLIYGNIIDLGPTGYDNNYMYLAWTSPAPCTPITGNLVESNIVISNFAGSANNTFNGYTGYAYTASNLQGFLPVPIVTANTYHNYGGGDEGSAGNTAMFSDAFPIHSDPLCTGWTYDLDPSSSMFLPPMSFPKIIKDWGPSGFAIPHTGTAPSCPH